MKVYKFNLFYETNGNAYTEYVLAKNEDDATFKLTKALIKAAKLDKLYPVYIDNPEIVLENVLA